ncbi:hypothetical protein F1880_008405 [Penicillium rolfsii]|nr:hypothetical protein F1880_008405 [Penicillium rolfsii]
MYFSALLGLTTMMVAISSSIFTAAIPYVNGAFGISQEVATLGFSLFGFGFTTGPLYWAPVSEIKGRFIPLTFSTLGFPISSIVTATAKEIQSLFIF